MKEKETKVTAVEHKPTGLQPGGLKNSGDSALRRMCESAFFLAMLSKVHLGEMYEIVYTSMQNGLYRYRTGDVVKIVNFFHQSPVYEFQFRSIH